MIKKVARPSKTCRCLYRRTLNVHLRRFNAAIRFQDGGGSRQQQPKDPPRMKCCTIWIWRFSGGFLFFFFVGDAQGGPAGPRLLWKSGGSDGWHSVTVWVGHFQSADADWQQVAFCVISIGPMCGPPPRQSIFCINKDKAHKRRRAEIEKIFNAAPLRRMHFSLNILFFFHWTLLPTWGRDVGQLLPSLASSALSFLCLLLNIAFDMDTFLWSL